MSSVGSKGVIIQDADGGDAVTVTNHRLDVNAQITVASDDINIGNVVLQNDAGTDIYSSLAGTDTSVLDQQLLLGTHALLSARKDANTTLGITCEDGDNNALHVAVTDGTNLMPTMDAVARPGFMKITDGTETVNVTTDNELEVHIESIDSAIAFVTKPAQSANVTNSSVTVGTGSTEICDAAATRLSYTIVNDSDEVIYLSIEDAAVMNSGIRLNPNGGSFSDVFAYDKVFGICASGSKNVTVCQQLI